MADPLVLDYERISAMDDGTNVDRFRRGGVVMITNPASSGTPLVAGTYFIETLMSVFQGRRVDYQIAQNIASGAELVRHGDGSQWSAWTSRASGGGGGSGTASGTSYDNATFPTPGGATDVQAALQELINATLPGGKALRTFNVLAYGADPTGVADSRAAFTNAIAAANAVGGGVIYAPAGTYSISFGASASLGGMILKDFMILKGDGPGRTIIKCADLGNKDMSGIVRTQSAVQNSWISIQDLTLDGNKAAQTGWAFITVFFCGVTPGDRVNTDRDIWLLNVEAKNGRNGTAGSGQVGKAGYGFDPHEITTRLTFINCLSHDNEEDGWTLDGCTDFKVMGCHSYLNGRHGINCVTESWNGQIVDSQIYSNTSNGITIQQDSHDMIVANNHIRDNGENGIRLRCGLTITETRNIVTGNRISKNGKNGIQITGCDRNVVSENYFADNSQLLSNTYMDVALDEDDGDSGGATRGAANNIIKVNTAIATLANKTKAAYRENNTAVNPPNNNVYHWNHAFGQLTGKYLGQATTSTISDAGYGSFYDASAFGVSASNSDNGPALRALQTLVAGRGGGTILLPVGTINASGTGTASQGVIALSDKVNLKGQGRGVTVLNALDPVNADISGVVRTLSGGTSQNITVSDLTITSAAPSGSGGVDLLFVGGASDNAFTAINVDLLNARDAGTGHYGLRVTSASTDARIIDVTATSCGKDGFLEAGTRTTYVNCYASANGRHGFYATAATSPQFLGCRGFNNATNQLIVENSTYAKVIGGHYDANSVAQDCLRIKGGATTSMHTLVEGVTIANAGHSGLSIAGADYNRVMSCSFIDNGRTTNNTYPDISIELNVAVTSNHNSISNNTMVATQANKTKYAVQEVATCDNNNIIWNKFVGQVTADVILAGAASFRFDRSFVQIKDSDFFLLDDGDVTKRVAFQLASLTTATTRTITIPDKSGTLAMLSDIAAATPAGADTQMQYNNAGAFAGAAGLTYDLANSRAQAVNPIEFKNATPAAAPANSVLAHTFKRGNMPFFAAVDEFGRKNIFQRHSGLGTRAEFIGGATTVTAVGISSSANGTVTAASYANTTRAQATKRSVMTTTAAAAQAAGMRMSSNAFFRGNAAGLGGYLMVAQFSLGIIDANTRGFIGMSTADLPAVSGPSTTALACFGVGFDAAATTFRFVSNPAAGTATYTDLGANFPVAVNTLYELVVFCKPNDTNLYYSLTNLETGNNANATVTTNLPGAGTFSGGQVLLNTGVGTSAIALDFVSLYVESTTF